MKLSKIVTIGFIIVLCGVFVKLMMSQTAKIILFALFYGPILQKFPEPTGPFAVGTTSYHLIDKGRTEKTGAARELIVQFWYPSDAKPNKKPIYPYMHDKIDEIIKIAKQDTSSYIPHFIWERLLNVKTYATPDAEISTTQTNYPVLIFSHGAGTYRDQYSVFFEDLASHGYIVVSIDHTGLNGLTVFPDGRVIIPDVSEIMDPNISRTEILAILNTSVQTCVQDIQFVMNQLSTINDNQNEKFYKKLDLDHLGVFGHSLGGMATVEACRVDQRIKAGVDIDGWIDFMTPKSVKKPFMCLLGEKSFLAEKICAPSKERQQFMRMNTQEYIDWQNNMQQSINEFCQNNGKFGYQIIIKNAGHMAFNDMVLAKRSVVQFLNLEIGSVEPHNAIKVTNTYIRTFFDKYLKDIDISNVKLCTLYPDDVIVKKCGNSPIKGDKI